MKTIFARIVVSGVLCLLYSCSCANIRQLDEELYSRHLQRSVKLTIINTATTGNKGSMNLLLLNDGQDMEQLRMKKIVDSLYGKKLIRPLLIIGIHAADRLKEYGVAGYPDYLGRGDHASDYDAFINDELYPFAKKKAGVSRFNSVVMAGCSLGGLSAFDIAWNHADWINKVGVFSGSFWWRDKDVKAADYSDEKDRIMLNKIRSSPKRPHLQYWFYAGGKEETSDRDNDGIIDVIDDTRDLMELIRSRKICSPDDIKYTQDDNGLHNQLYWSRQLPVFLEWAFPKTRE